MSADEEGAGGSDLIGTKTDRISIALVGVRREEHRANPLLANIWVTQVSKTQLYVPIEKDHWHIVFYNSKTLRLPALKKNLSSIIPRTVLNEIGEKLQNAPIGRVMSDGDRFYVCVENTSKNVFSKQVVVQGLKSVLELSKNIYRKKNANNGLYYYLSNGSSNWLVGTFLEVGEQVNSLQNFIVSTNASNFNENLDGSKEHVTQAGQKRCLPPPPRGECWPVAPYRGIVNLAILNPEEGLEGEEREGEADPNVTPPVPTGTADAERLFSQTEVNGLLEELEAKLMKKLQEKLVPTIAVSSQGSAEAIQSGSQTSDRIPSPQSVPKTQSFPLPITSNGMKRRRRENSLPSIEDVPNLTDDSDSDVDGNGNVSSGVDRMPSPKSVPKTQSIPLPSTSNGMKRRRRENSLPSIEDVPNLTGDSDSDVDGNGNVSSGVAASNPPSDFPRGIGIFSLIRTSMKNFRV